MRLLLAVSMGAFLLACNEHGADTCGGGDNMSSPAVTLEQDPQGNFLRLRWDRGTGRGAELPPAYFAGVTLADPSRFDSGTVAASVHASQDREIMVRLAALDTLWAGADGGAPSGAPVTMTVQLEFPDRKQFIDCSHPGMTDIYWLRMVLTFAPPGVLQSKTLSQGVSLGAI
jgi:hypothetical protein